MKEPLVSVIIPSYNRFEYLLNAVNSVKDQTYKNYEIIVINDESSQKEYYENTIEDINIEKKRMEIKFSCGEEGIQKYIDEGWVIIKESTEEKICTWKSVPASKECDMNKDKGCKITKPDKIGEEKIYLMEK